MKDITKEESNIKKKNLKITTKIPNIVFIIDKEAKECQAPELK